MEQREKLYQHLVDTCGDKLDTEMPLLFILWMLGDLAKDFGFNFKQLDNIARSIMNFFISCDLERPEGTLTNIVDTVLQVLYDDELLALEETNDAFDYIVDLLISQREMLLELIQFGG